MWPRRRSRAASAAILLLFHAFAGGHARRGHDGLDRGGAKSVALPDVRPRHRWGVLLGYVICCPL